ncbi:MAG: sulfite exporter TauE/SafE family protein [Gammaproteobacteria bacterium]
MELIAYLLTGALAGLMAGLLGIGGGLVIVPALAWLFTVQGFDGATLMHFAVGTSLATIVPTALSSLLAHHRRGSVDWLTVRGLAPGIVIGALGGAALARVISSPGLALFFGLFEIAVALQLAFGGRPASHRGLPGRMGLGLAGGVIGLLSALLGIGGGTLTTPFLLWNGLDIHRAVGTSASCGLPVALAGAAGFAVAGLHSSFQPGLNTGFVVWPAMAAITVTSVLLAPAGARLAHHLSASVLQRVFALLLLLLGIKMLWSALYQAGP